jgi:hypothetical protein
MDKPRHPQVIRPWKLQQAKQGKFKSSGAGEPRHGHAGKLELHSEKQKNAGK